MQIPKAEFQKSQTSQPQNTLDPRGKAVDAIVRSQQNVDLKLTGFSLSVTEAGDATVDLMRSPDSKRQFESLSTCEQLSLFGSIEETLTKNPEFQVKSVKFTENGQEIVR
jgi:hypothetical protein